MIVVLLVSIAGFVATATSRVLKAAHDFEVLGLPVELASQATIQNAYHRLSRAIHPDHACKWEDAVCTQAASYNSLIRPAQRGHKRNRQRTDRIDRTDRTNGTNRTNVHSVKETNKEQKKKKEDKRRKKAKRKRERKEQ